MPFQGICLMYPCWPSGPFLLHMSDNFPASCTRDGVPSVEGRGSGNLAEKETERELPCFVDARLDDGEEEQGGSCKLHNG